MVYLTGDTHGDLDRFRHGRLRWLGKRDIVVVLGDFGFVWDGSKEEQKKLDWLRKRPYTLLFLDGAHENYDLLAQYPVEERFGGRVQALGGNVYHVCRGSVLELEGKKYLCFGGAETMCENLTYALGELGHDVVVVSLFDERTEISAWRQQASASGT